MTQSESFLINASAFGLMLSGRVMRWDEPAHDLGGRLRGLLGRLGEPVVREVQGNGDAKALRQVYVTGFADLLPADQAGLKDDVVKAFHDAIVATKAAGDDLAAAVVHQDHRKPVTSLLVKVNHLRDLLRQQMPPALGVTLGFNELDGDGS